MVVLCLFPSGGALRELPHAAGTQKSSARATPHPTASVVTAALETLQQDVSGECRVPISAYPQYEVSGTPQRHPAPTEGRAMSIQKEET